MDDKKNGALPILKGSKILPLPIQELKVRPPGREMIVEVDSTRAVIPIAPVGQMRARHGTVMTKRGPLSLVYKDKKQRSREDTLRTLLIPARPPKPYQGPLEMLVMAVLPIPKSWPRKKREQALLGHIRPVVKPDLDNIIKHIKDIMKGLFYDDDKQIVGYLPGTGKYYGSEARWEIMLKPLEREMP